MREIIQKSAKWLLLSLVIAGMAVVPVDKAVAEQGEAAIASAPPEIRIGNGQFALCVGFCTTGWCCQLIFVPY